MALENMQTVTHKMSYTATNDFNGLMQNWHNSSGYVSFALTHRSIMEMLRKFTHLCCTKVTVAYSSIYLFYGDGVALCKEFKQSFSFALHIKSNRKWIWNDKLLFGFDIYTPVIKWLNMNKFIEIVAQNYQHLIEINKEQLVI